jgi:hypothetical protein
MLAGQGESNRYGKSKGKGAGKSKGGGNDKNKDDDGKTKEDDGKSKGDDGKSKEDDKSKVDIASNLGGTVDSAGSSSATGKSWSVVDNQSGEWQ